MRKLFILVSFVMPVLAGCGGKDKVKLVPARGTILLKAKDGKLAPMGGARVVFNPDASHDTKAAYPAANCNEEGAFELGTFTAADGAPEGEYVVTVEWKGKQILDPKKDVFHRGAVDGPDRLGGAYSDRSRSPLRATVAAGQEMKIIVPAP